MVADKVTKMDAKMVIKSIFRVQNVQLELVAGGCADNNVSSRLVGEVVDVVGMVADRQVVEEEVDMLEQQVTMVDTNMYKDREQNLGSKLLSVMIILVLEVVREVIGVFQQVMDMQVNKVKDQEVHNVMTRSPGRQPRWTRTQNLASQLLEDDYLKHLLVHHHLGNIQSLNNSLYEYFLYLQPSAPTLILLP